MKLHITAVTVAAIASLALAGCSTSDTADDNAATPAAEGSFPVTVDHMYGETTVDALPERVATWGFGTTDAVLALGVVPVAIPSAEYGGGDDLMYPWVSDAIEDLGGQTPVLLDNSAYELPVEQLLATDPDVLMAPHSGLTQAEFDAVTAAGIPVVAPPEELWSTPWRDVITTTGDVLGRADEARDLVADLDRQVTDAGDQHPEFDGRSIAYVSEAADVYYLLLPTDPRVELLENLGFTTPESVTSLSNGESPFSTTVSAENISKIDADVVFTQVDTDQALQEFLTSDVSRQIPAVAKGAVAGFVGQEAGSAIGPTALSIPFFLPTLVDGLADATEVAGS
ncbi:iron ABC transporter substrate-binding protein [Rhodococcus sp. 06-156-3C]|uniref:ABC transporter substrate-binding protein n=1 Tax=Nocardiaceae TaxID=85025 RepID=UPI000522FB52|nr:MULTISPECIES: ABC transporter substrate-binding protein [Rhodococcus]OZD17764.1 iron ABC transporter substrate-binding protein [Rhodococcus sp. 06-156-4C]OZD21435.1 iron ABC transporter substrate-binding protein [Rhodococcus sp. 06-156-4a]OZD24018.1 iron ABC transporter substrate-binding protein [Rhodococcus sp. 06-156-3b]OZD25191.1 iron ABC transporter substrate-binding protein [Rhodococcus sp. 06-156-3C]OZD40135.1 iron ABC transporter substrate-binding protein [Rhodococcus sp. 06-156-3]